MGVGVRSGRRPDEGWGPDGGEARLRTGDQMGTGGQMGVGRPDEAGDRWGWGVRSGRRPDEGWGPDGDRWPDGTVGPHGGNQ